MPENLCPNKVFRESRIVEPALQKAVYALRVVKNERPIRNEEVIVLRSLAYEIVCQFPM